MELVKRRCEMCCFLTLANPDDLFPLCEKCSKEIDEKYRMSEQEIDGIVQEVIRRDKELDAAVKQEKEN